MNSNYYGAKWWKFDFHTHTPASADFMQYCDEQTKSQVTPKFWLRKFMEKGIDCVAITDHNSGASIDEYKSVLNELEENKPNWYRSIYLFPGVEISTNNGVHLLAIFGSEKTTSDISSLLGAVGYEGTFGKSDDVTKKSLYEVIDAVVIHEGLPIPAHVDKNKGLFSMSGTSLGKVLNNSNLIAMEICDPCFAKPPIYKEKKLNLTEVCGSDTHNFREGNFGVYTWIKMDEPTIEGLKLALIDGSVSVIYDMNQAPNNHANFVIEEFTVENARYIGRAEQFNCKFSPFLNTIIGGRGSGKSTLLEFMRLVLRRHEDIPQALQKDAKKYFEAGEEKLLLDDSSLSMVCRKGDVLYRLKWSSKATGPSLEEDSDGDWKPIEGDIRSLFPVYIFSQKQIFELANNPRYLLNIIDQSPLVDYQNFLEKYNELVNKYRKFEFRQAELKAKLSQERRLKGELSDLEHQIRQIEQSGHKEILQNYRKRQLQLAAVGAVEKNWREMKNVLETALEKFTEIEFSENLFLEEDMEISIAVKNTNQKWMSVQGKLALLVDESKSILQQWSEEKDCAQWINNIHLDISKYEQLYSELKQLKIDPEKYPTLLQNQEIVKSELETIKEYASRIQEIEAQKDQVIEDIEDIRKKLSARRQEFLDHALSKSSLVSIRVNPFGENSESIEKKLRELLHCEDHFDKDITCLIKKYEASQSGHDYKVVKQSIKGILKGELEPEDGRFASHLKKLPQESIVNMLLWYPNDDLEIKIDGSRKISQGSPGQKTAALLTFFLSYGQDPLLLDQPEDDLDNELIYELVVKQLRENKSRRQMIIVTHNANIVVNGDAEMVIPLSVINGQTKCEENASIQNQRVRNKICDVLEGGQQAFKQRYKRIHLGVLKND